MKVFLDTNVLLSALVAKGVCHDLVVALKTTSPNPFERIQCHTCERVLLELMRLILVVELCCLINFF